MSKIVLAILAAAAFFYALWLVLLGRPLPDLSRASGLRRRFLLAATLFAALFSVVSCSEVGRDPMCYRLPLQPTRVEGSATDAVVTTLQAVWRTLDEKKSAQFEQQLAALATRGIVKDSVTNVLSLAFAEVAYHRGRTRGTGKFATCYKMTPLGGTLSDTRETALKQIELLRNARAKGTINSETAAKARATLARELEMLRLARLIRTYDPKSEQALIEQYQSDSIATNEDALSAAEIIVEMESARPPVPTPSEAHRP